MRFNLDKYIRELLLQHDCVILPGMGGFIANYKSAEFDVAQKTVIPPSRQILFNTNLVHNDGLLYAYISKETGYGYKEVQAIAEVYFKTIKYEIGKGLKFTIDDLGYFFLNRVRQVEFKQELTDNLLLTSYGLPYLKYKEFDRIPVRTKYYHAADDIDPVIRQRRIRRWVYTSAAACLIAAMTLMPVRMGNLNISSFDVRPTDSHLKEQPVMEIGAETTTPETDVQTLAGEQTLSPDPAEPVKAISANEVSYHIIVGSFKEINNARQLQHQMVQEGFKAEILTGDNAYYRVSAEQFPEKQAAIAALSSFRAKQAYKSAWLLSL
jgi:hypothetical protein